MLMSSWEEGEEGWGVLVEMLFVAQTSLRAATLR